MIKDKYIEYQLNHGHLGLGIEEKGVVIDQDNAFLAASVDGEVHDRRKHRDEIQVISREG